MCHSGASSANAETWWPPNLPRWFGNGFVNLQRHFDESTGKYLHTDFQETKVELYKFLKNMMIIITGSTVWFQQSQPSIWRWPNSRW